MILETFAYYIMLGVAFNLLYDLLVSWLRNSSEEYENLRFSISERIFVVLTWPIPFLRLIYGIVSTLLKK
jgi:hypothetical protein